MCMSLNVCSAEESSEYSSSGIVDKLGTLWYVGCYIVVIPSMGLLKDLLNDQCKTSEGCDSSRMSISFNCRFSGSSDIICCCCCK